MAAVEVGARTGDGEAVRAKIVWMVLHQEVEYKEKGSAPPNERTLVRKFRRMIKEFGKLGLDARALLDRQLPAPA